MDTTTLIIGIITGAFGTGYIIYGRNEQRMVPMISGVILCVYPYFIDNIWILCGGGIILILLPFIVSFIS
ncbi:MAG: amino acid transport protein [Candidatus Gracilibacteria bacterium]|nr:amino acid transport protein [Candidatus Gracilibacteria bacterium]